MPLFSSSAGLRVGLQAKRTLGKNYLAFQVASDAMGEKLGATAAIPATNSRSSRNGTLRVAVFTVALG